MEYGSLVVRPARTLVGLLYFGIASIFALGWGYTKLGALPMSRNTGETWAPLTSWLMRASKKTLDSGEIRLRMERVIRAIPRGKVLTYGGVAKAAGYPGRSRMVARLLQRGYGLPWQRVLGAGGEIKLRGDSRAEQRFRLESEGVRFRGRRVDMKTCEWKPGLAKRRKPRPMAKTSGRKK